MGADICLFVEKKVGDVWEAVTPPKEYAYFPDREGDIEWDTDRSYKFFAPIADIRNYEEVDQPFGVRGFPEDLSVGMQKVKDDYDSWVQPSWLTIEELLELPKLIPQYDLKKESSFYLETLPRIISVVQGEPARIVFWFDQA